MRPTATSATLLEGLKDPANRTVWQQYVDRFRPVLVGYGRRLGLGDADAEDVAQETLVAFSNAYRDGRYDAKRGRLRSWLLGIATTVVRNWRRRLARDGASVGGTATGFLENLADEDHLAAQWEEEWREMILAECLAQVREEVEPDVFAAFERFAVRGLPARQVAAELGTTEAAVFNAKRRVLRRVRRLRPGIDEAW